MSSPAFVGLAGLAVAAAAGIAVSDHAGPLAGTPAVWAAAGACAAAGLVALRWRARKAALPVKSWRRAAELACAGFLAATLAAGDRADLAAARAELGPWLDDRAEETLSGTVAAPVEDDGRALRFALDLDALPRGEPEESGGRGEDLDTGASAATPRARSDQAAAPSKVAVSGSPARVLPRARIRVIVSVFREPDDPAWTPAILPGDRIEVTGTLRLPRGYLIPGGPPARRSTDTRGAVALLATDWTRLTASGTADGHAIWRAAARLQRRVANRISEAAGERDRDGVLRALVTGDISSMSERVTARYRDSGASHVLAVSGLHLAAVALFAFAALRRLWASVPALALRVDPTRAAASLAAPIAVGYTMMTGVAPSAVRSLWMVLMVLFGAALDRRARVSDALGGAALVMLVVQPASLYDPSLQLSFAATSALAVFMGARRGAGQSAAGRPHVLVRAAARLWRGLRELVVASLWTWAATAPISAVHFGAVALAGPIANLVAVPAVELVALPLGLVGAAASEVWPAAGAAILTVAAVMTSRVTDALAHVAAWIPPLPLPPPDLVELAAWSLLLGVAAAVARQVATRPVHRRTMVAVGAAAALVLAGSWLWRTALGPAHRAELRIAFVDVGQGDAAVIELPGGGVWLIDGGGLPYSLPMRDPDAARRLAESPGREAVARYLAERRIRHIDLAILSHGHPDHYRGLGPIARAVSIDELWLVHPHPDAPPGGELAGLLAELAARGTRVRSPPPGAILRRGGVALTVLAPGPSPDADPWDPPVVAADPIRSENDNSLVVRVDFAGRRVLFTGDIEEEGEEDLVLAHRAELQVDLVKVAHHGSGTSSTPALIAATSPTWAIISCGPLNRFGFPNPEVVARWIGAGTRVLRTDQLGTITAIIAPDGAMELESVLPGAPGQ
ncbi:MAG TPA: DNA internalization-related competence protein ComEC/Rec2 [Kofleriaceae bacterium]|nr:DNA internalization-related competence protein ComEC/Rec2 [Kofleriaceae bacterium]